MGLTFQSNGNLTEGIHRMTVEEFEIEFGSNTHRKKLIEGLKVGMRELRDCGCKTIFIDGSFVTTKEIPGDFDACWDDKGVDLSKLFLQYSTIVSFANEREVQKKKYFGEFFPMRLPAIRGTDILYLTFFQQDKEGNPKGIVQIDLN